MENNIEELEKQYSELADEELLRMHASGQLTEDANNILENELKHRGIDIPFRSESDDKLSDKTRGKLPTSIKVAVGFAITYGLFRGFEPILAGAPPYWVGSGIGVLILIAILAWALLRVKKYGWGFSVFLIVMQAAQLISQYIETTKAEIGPEELAGISIGIAFYLLLLFVALVALFMPSSRKPFKELRNTSKK